MKDLHSKIKTSTAIAPAAAPTANGTTTGVTIDTDGYNSLEFAIQSGVITDGSFTPAVYHGDAANMSDEVVCTATELIGTIAAATFADTADSLSKRIGYKGGKRYVRLKLVQAGATSGGFISAVAIQGEPVYAPVP